jgi:hypothetical protein
MGGASNYLDKKLLNHVYGNTAYTAPATIYVALHLATTLTANAAASQNQISTTHHITAGASVTIDPVGGSPETFTVSSVSGSGPYTVTLSGNLVHPFNSGTYVKFDPGKALADLLEPSGNNYSRKAVTNNTTNFPVATDAGDLSGIITNGAAITCPTASGAWGLVTHFANYDASTAGNSLGRGALGTPKLINSNGDYVQFNIGDMTLTMD